MLSKASKELLMPNLSLHTQWGYFCFLLDCVMSSMLYVQDFGGVRQAMKGRYIGRIGGTNSTKKRRRHGFS